MAFGCGVCVFIMSNSKFCSVMSVFPNYFFCGGGGGGGVGGWGRVSDK